MVFVFPFISYNWDLSLWNKWSTVFYGIITTGAFLYLGYKVGIKRYYIFAILSVIGVLAAYFIEFETFERGLEMYFLGMSGFMFVAGFALFIIFLRSYKLFKEEITDDK
jgi:Na+-driven multidrug efflux pump